MSNSVNPVYDSIEHLRITLDDAGVMRLVLDKPAKRNALDDDMMYKLIDVFDLAGRDDDVRAIVLSGAGDHFCGGFDIVSRNANNDRVKPRVGSIQRRLPSQAHRLIPLVASIQTPVIVSARGWIAGIGLHLAVAADVAVVTDDARVWEPFSARGFTPDSGATWLLPRRVGEVRARELLLLGRVLNGQEAASWGLVHRSVPDDGLDKATDEVVQQLATGATVSLGLTKWLMHVGHTAPLDEQLRNEALAMELSSRSEDFREGLSAFTQKRPPEFKGR